MDATIVQSSRRPRTTLEVVPNDRAEPDIAEQNQARETLIKSFLSLFEKIFKFFVQFGRKLLSDCLYTGIGVRYPLILNPLLNVRRTTPRHASK